MAENVSPGQGMNDIVQQTSEQTRKAIESGIEFFQKTMTASPWLASPDLNKKIQGYMQENINAATEFVQKLAQVKDVSEFLSVQFEFIQSQWKAFGEQAKDLGETMTKGAISSKGLSS